MSEIEIVCHLNLDVHTYGIEEAEEFINMDASVEELGTNIIMAIRDSFPDAQVEIRVHRSVGWIPGTAVWVDGEKDEEMKREVDSIVEAEIGRYGDWVVYRECRADRVSV